MEVRFVGIDLGVRTMEIRFLDANGRSVDAWHGKTSGSGRAQLYRRLRKSDCIGIEACALGFVVAREIIREVGAKVYVLNSSRMYMIFRSIKKTDSEDAMKIARLICAYPEQALPVVAIPNESDERNRALVSEIQFLIHSRTRYMNRLHSVFLRQGISTITKAHLKVGKRRTAAIELLDGHRREEALRLDGYVRALEAGIKAHPMFFVFTEILTFADIKALEDRERQYLGEDEKHRMCTDEKKPIERSMAALLTSGEIVTSVRYKKRHARSVDYSR